MSGRPYRYGRAMAIAQLMKDHRRPAIQEIVKKNKEHYDMLVKSRDKSGLDYPVCGPHGPQTVYLHGKDFYVAFEDTIDWVPKLEKVGPNGEAHGSIIEGWPTEEEIAAEIAASAEREKNWGGSLSDCRGYYEKPLPGSLWPGETREEFGF